VFSIICLLCNPIILRFKNDKKIKIVLIDSGVDQYDEYKGINVLKVDNEFIVNNDIKDEIGHGTQMLKIINKHNKNIDFFYH